MSASACKHSLEARQLEKPVLLVIAGLPWSVSVPAPNGIWSEEDVQAMLESRSEHWDALCQKSVVPAGLQQMHAYAQSLKMHEMPNYDLVRSMLYSMLPSTQAEE